ncbi:hypothetical protein [Scytonema sp. NUACC26]|uniref:hypothetical protein n=1 Tax=Scytonema sp. NUACC26 TaxID=3140176 RepID=UPI0038B32770
MTRFLVPGFRKLSLSCGTGVLARLLQLVHHGINKATISNREKADVQSFCAFCHATCCSR